MLQRLAFLLLCLMMARSLAGQELRVADSLRAAAYALPADSLGAQASLLHQAGLAASRAGEHGRAIDWTLEALTLRRSDPERFAEGILLSTFNLGTYYNLIGSYREAQRYFTAVLDMAPNRKEGLAYYYLAQLYGKRGAFGAGVAAFERAAALPPFRDESYYQAFLRQQIGELHLQKPKGSGAAAAIRPLEAATAFFRGDEDDAGLAGSLTLLSWAYSDAGHQQRALAVLEEGLGVIERAPELQDGAADIWQNIGVAQRRSGNLAAAEVAYRKALDLERAEANNELDVAIAYNNLSTLALKKGQPDSARRYAELALAELGLWQNGYYHQDQYPQYPNETLGFLGDLAATHVAAGTSDDLTAALKLYRTADELLDQMRREQLLEETRRYWRADARALYDAAIRLCVRTDDAETAFYFMEKARARLLIDEISQEQAINYLAESERVNYREQLRRLRSSTADARQTANFRQLQERLLTQYPAFAAGVIGPTPPDFSDLPSLLGERVLVEYWSSDQLLIALVKEPGAAARLVSIPTASEWPGQIASYRRSLADPDRPFPFADGYRLYEQLISRLDIAVGKQLLVIPDEHLHGLAFSALPVAPEASPLRTATWVADRYAIGYGFSVQLLAEARAQKGRGNGRALAMAPLVRLQPSDDIAPQLELPATGRTLGRLAEVLPADTLVNATATRTAFDSLADNYSLLHLGTHAFADGSPGFLLRDSANALYTVDDLLRRQLKADLVVLAACQTGVGEIIAGEGIASLGRGFARRGAPNLITGLWNLDDGATDAVLTDVYPMLAEGIAPVAALREAAARYRSEAPSDRLAHPVYWAGLAYFGTDEPVVLKQQSGWLAYLGYACLVALGLSALFWART